MRRRQRRVRKGGEALRFVLVKSWLRGSTIMLSFMIEEYDDLERSTHEQEEWPMMTIGFEFPRRLKNSAITFQTVIRQPVVTDLINGPV
jgi:hypothetical protein